jgi:hypothetical protein
MASPAELVFKTPDLCAAILRSLPVSDVASAACVSTWFKRAAAVHWSSLRARTLPLSGALHNAVGAAATLRMYDAAARAAREQAAWNRDAAQVTQLACLRFVLHVHSADGALIFAAAASPRIVLDARGREEVAFGAADAALLQNAAPADGANRDAALLLQRDAPARLCTASLFVERTLAGGGVRVACLFSGPPAAVRSSVTAPPRDEEDEAEVDDYYDDFYEDSDWLDELLKAVPPDSHDAVVFTNTRRMPPSTDARGYTTSVDLDAEVSLPPLLDFYIAGGNLPGCAKLLSGWFSATLHVPLQASREVTACVQGALFQHHGGYGTSSVETRDLQPKELLQLLRGLQWQSV